MTRTMQPINVYVAGKTHDFEAVRTIQDAVRHAGHNITHDWTSAVEHHGPEHEAIAPSPVEQRMYAELDMRGVRNADLVIARGHPKVCGTLWELGAASALGIPSWLINWEVCQHSIFVHLPHVRLMNGMDHLMERIELLHMFVEPRTLRA